MMSMSLPGVLLVVTHPWTDWSQKPSIENMYNLHIFLLLNNTCLDTEAGKVEASPDEMLGVKLDLRSVFYNF